MHPLGPVYDLLSSSAKKPLAMNCKLVLRLRLQFFHSSGFFCTRVKLHSTHRLGMP